MDSAIKIRFLQYWREYFPGAELPLLFYYADEAPEIQSVSPEDRQRCIICELARVRQGTSLRFDVDAVACGGAKRYLGFVQELRPNFEYFLSCGIPGKMEGERYKKSPELVREVLRLNPPFQAPGRTIVFKRWDALEEEDDPLAVVFFAPPDVLSGLFTLVNFDEVEQGVIAPFCSGCASIVYHPYHELKSERPRAILGRFDVSARPCVPAGVLTLAVPWPKLADMVANIPESFLITKSWEQVRERF
jgi:hypothetical protein